MSTILNALKQLEDSEQVGEANKAAIPVGSGTGAPLRPSRPIRLIAVSVLTIVFGAAILVWFGGAWLGSLRPADNATKETAGAPSHPEASFNTPPVETNPASGAPLKTKADYSGSAPSRIAARGEKRAEARPVMTSPDYIPPNIAPRRREANRRQPPTRQKAQAAAALSNPDATVPSGNIRTESIPDMSLSRGSADQPSPPQNEAPYTRAQVIAKDTLQLQAISWSDVPSARITIIAGRILREGQNVDGFTVVEIRPEDVIVEKAGIYWKVVYGDR